MSSPAASAPSLPSSVVALGYAGLLPFAAATLGSVLLDGEHRAFSLRIPEISAPFKVQGEIVRTFADYLRGLGFTEVHTSKIVSAGTEGRTALFPIKYFEQQAYLVRRVVSDVVDGAHPWELCDSG